MGKHERPKPGKTCQKCGNVMYFPRTLFYGFTYKYRKDNSMYCNNCYFPYKPFES